VGYRVVERRNIDIIAGLEPVHSALAVSLIGRKAVQKGVIIRLAVSESGPHVELYKDQMKWQ
jgi:hypothetical protein